MGYCHSHNLQCAGTEDFVNSVNELDEANINMVNHAVSDTDVLRTKMINTGKALDAAGLKSLTIREFWRPRFWGLS